MKALAGCLAVIVLLIVVAVARYQSGSADLTAAESAQVAAQAFYRIADEHRIPLPQRGLLDDALNGFLQPGAYLATRLGALPDSGWELSVVAVGSWWIWVTVARLLWSILGRAFGVATIGDFHYWLMLVPPWRSLYRAWMTVSRWLKQFRFGKSATAAWTGALAAMTLVYKPGDSIFLGRPWVHGIGLFQAIGIAGSRHIAVIASSGAGKTRWLKAWLGMLHKKASAFVVDTDGEIVNALGASLERDGHRVLNLDPYHLTNFPGACWNALDEITAAVHRHGRQAAVRFAQTLAEALIRDDNSHQPVFANTARVFLHGLILYVWLFEPPEQRHLVRVRELLTRGLPELVIEPKQDPFELLLRRMEDAIRFDDECDGEIVAVIARAASVMRSGKGREGNPFRTTAIAQTAWIDIPEIAAISKKSDFTSEDLKLTNAWVSVCAPVTDIQNKLSGWVRALLMTSLYTFENIPGKLKIPCVFAIDEMPSLGRIEALETAAPVFRRFGVRLVAISQDLERLKQAYPSSYGSFLGNAQAILWLGNDHQGTLEELSKMLGNTTLVKKVKSGLFSRIPPRMEVRIQPLLTPDQAREFLDPDLGQFIVTRAGKPPLRVAYEGFDKALAVWRYARDKGYREPLLRATTRWILSSLRVERPPRRVGTALPKPATDNRIKED